MADLYTDAAYGSTVPMFVDKTKTGFCQTTANLRGSAQLNLPGLAAKIGIPKPKMKNLRTKMAETKPLCYTFT